MAKSLSSIFRLPIVPPFLEAEQLKPPFSMALCSRSDHSYGLRWVMVDRASASAEGPETAIARIDELLASFFCCRPQSAGLGFRISPVLVNYCRSHVTLRCYFSIGFRSCFPHSDMPPLPTLKEGGENKMSGKI